MTPKISVIIPISDRAWYLMYSLLHYTRQTMKEFEVLVLDDDSLDNVEDVCRAFKNRLNIRLFKSSRKVGSVGLARYRSAGPLLNFAIKNVMQSNIVLYSDAEVIPFQDFVENHYKAHIPGYKIEMPKEFSAGIPFNLETPLSDIIVPEEPSVVRGMTTKTWIENSDMFGDLKLWESMGELLDIESFYTKYWSAIIGNMGTKYVPYGPQDFWGFQGSQAGLSFPRELFIQVGGWNEDLDIPGTWMGEDGELGGRFHKAGAFDIENPRIKAVHLYHYKAPVYTDEIRREMITKRNNDLSYRIANVGMDWGSGERLKIQEISL